MIDSYPLSAPISHTCTLTHIVQFTDVIHKNEVYSTNYELHFLSNST